MKTEEYIDLAELSEDELADFCNDEEKVLVVYEHPTKDKKLRFALIVNPQNVEMSDFARYRKDASEISLRANGAKDTLKAMDEKPKEEGIVNEVELEAVKESINISVDLTEADALLLSKLVVRSEPAIPGYDFTDPKLLAKRGGLGAAARDALHDYFFGSSTEPEAETGETETAPSVESSDTSVATETKGTTPPTS